MSMQRRVLLVSAFLLGTAPAWAVSEAKDCPATEPITAVYGDVFSGTNCQVTPTGDVDVLQFTGSKDETIRLIAVDLGGSPFVGICVELFGPDNVLVVPKACTDVSLELNPKLAMTGVHRILVTEWGNDATLPYALSLERLFPPRGNWPPIDFGQTVSDEINPTSDVDPFRFAGNAGDLVRIIAVDLSGSPFIGVCAEVLGPDGIPVVVKTCVDVSVELNPTLTMTGVHTVVVSEWGNDAAFPYSLSLHCLSGACPKLPVCDVDLTYTPGTLGLTFTLRTVTPATWNLWVSAQTTTTKIKQLPLQPIDPPQEFSASVPLPAIGTIGFLSTLTTPEKGIICSDWETVDTGISGTRTPSIEQIENLLRAAPILPRKP